MHARIHHMMHLFVFNQISRSASESDDELDQVSMCGMIFCSIPGVYEDFLWYLVVFYMSRRVLVYSVSSGCCVYSKYMV